MSYEATSTDRLTSTRQKMHRSITWQLADPL